MTVSMQFPYRPPFLPPQLFVNADGRKLAHFIIILLLHIIFHTSTPSVSWSDAIVTRRWCYLPCRLYFGSTVQWRTVFFCSFFVWRSHSEAEPPDWLDCRAEVRLVSQLCWKQNKTSCDWWVLETQRGVFSLVLNSIRIDPRTPCPWGGRCVQRV